MLNTSNTSEINVKKFAGFLLVRSGLFLVIFANTLSFQFVLERLGVPNKGVFCDPASSGTHSMLCDLSTTHTLLACLIALSFYFAIRRIVVGGFGIARIVLRGTQLQSMSAWGWHLLNIAFGVSIALLLFPLYQLHVHRLASIDWPVFVIAYFTFGCLVEVTPLHAGYDRYARLYTRIIPGMLGVMAIGITLMTLHLRHRIDWFHHPKQIDRLAIVIDRSPSSYADLPVTIDIVTELLQHQGNNWRPDVYVISCDRHPKLIGFYPHDHAVAQSELLALQTLPRVDSQDGADIVGALRLAVKVLNDERSTAGRKSLFVFSDMQVDQGTNPPTTISSLDEFDWTAFARFHRVSFLLANDTGGGDTGARIKQYLTNAGVPRHAQRVVGMKPSRP